MIDCVLRFMPKCAACGSEEDGRWYKRDDGTLVCRECATPGLSREDCPEGYLERRYRAACTTEPLRALMTELLDVGREGEAMDDATGLANWLVDFAPKLKEQLGAGEPQPVFTLRTLGGYVGIRLAADAADEEDVAGIRPTWRGLELTFSDRLEHATAGATFPDADVLAAFAAALTDAARALSSPR